MIKFQKYNSIENSYRQLFVDKCDQLGCKSWVVTEKVHGAKSVSMYVTHAILPYGIQHLIDKGLDKFYYYHIFREDLKSHPSIDSIT